MFRPVLQKGKPTDARYECITRAGGLVLVTGYQLCSSFTYGCKGCSFVVCLGKVPKGKGGGKGRCSNVMHCTSHPNPRLKIKQQSFRNSIFKRGSREKRAENEVGKTVHNFLQSFRLFFRIIPTPAIAPQFVIECTSKKRKMFLILRVALHSHPVTLCSRVIHCQLAFRS